MVIHGNRVVGLYDEFLDALEAVAETGGGEIYRVELVAKLSEEEAHALKEALLTTAVEPVEAPVKREAGVAIVFDRGYDVEVAKKISSVFRDARIYLLTSDVDNVKREDNVVIMPVKNEIDTRNIVDELLVKGYKILFFTSNKKLYTHLSLNKRIKALYRPLNEYEDLDKLVETIIEDIRKAMG